MLTYLPCSYLLSFDCVRFNQYLETLLSSHTTSIGALDRRDRPAWLGTAAADTIFSVARNRVYLQKAVAKPGEGRKERELTVDGMDIPDDLNADDWLADGPTEEEEQLLRDLEETARREKEARDRAAGVTNAEDKEAMPPPQVPQPKKPKKKGWLPPGVDPVLEEQPKWMVLAEVLDEIETSIHFSPHDPCALPSSP